MRRTSLYIVFGLMLITFSACCSQEALEPQPLESWGDFVETHVHQWLDLRLDATDAIDLQLSSHPIHTVSSQRELVTVLADYGNAELLVEQLTQTEFYPEPPPSETEFVALIVKAIESFRLME